MDMYVKGGIPYPFHKVGLRVQRGGGAAVNHVVNLFKPVFRAALHAEIVKDKQREAAKAIYVFVPALVAGGKVIEYQSKIRHAHGNLTLHKGVGDTPGEIALVCASLSCLYALFTGRCISVAKGSRPL